MKRLYIIMLALTICAVSSQAFAQSRTKMAVGGYLGAGASFVAGDGAELINIIPRENRTGKFSGAFGVYFDYYFIPSVALEVGLGFNSQGIHWKNNDGEFKIRHFYMELPVMVKFNIKHFQIGVGLGLWFALSGKNTFKNYNNDTTTKHTWHDNDWDYLHRVNIGPKLQFGYAIPVGPVSLVPSISWSMHLVNDLNRDHYQDDYPNVNVDRYRARYNNLMFNFAVEFGF